MIDESMTFPVVFDVAKGAYVPFSASYGRSWDSSEILRSGRDIELTGTLYKDAFLGLAHEIKGGLLFSNREARSVSGMPQNYEITRNFTDPLIDLGEGLVVPPSEWQRFVVTRSNRQANLAKRTSAFIQDTFSKGRFTFQLGLRYDYQQPSTDAVGISTVVSSWSNIYTNDAMTALANYIPALAIDPIDPRYEWSTWSPRIGISWDLKGDGRTMLKLSLAQYGDVLAAGANTPRPLGVTGSMAFWWKDAGRRQEGRCLGDVLAVFRGPPRNAEPALRPARREQRPHRRGLGRARGRLRERRLSRRELQGLRLRRQLDRQLRQPDDVLPQRHRSRREERQDLAPDARDHAQPREGAAARPGRLHHRDLSAL